MSSCNWDIIEQPSLETFRENHDCSTWTMAWRCLRDALEYTLASLKPKLPHGGDDDDDGPVMVGRGRMHSGRG